MTDTQHRAGDSKERPGICNTGGRTHSDRVDEREEGETHGVSKVGDWEGGAETPREITYGQNYELFLDILNFSCPRGMGDLQKATEDFVLERGRGRMERRGREVGWRTPAGEC